MAIRRASSRKAVGLAGVTLAVATSKTVRATLGCEYVRFISQPRGAQASSIRVTGPRKDLIGELGKTQVVFNLRVWLSFRSLIGREGGIRTRVTIAREPPFQGGDLNRSSTSLRNWYSVPDSNRCYRRERAVSWASRRTELGTFLKGEGFPPSSPGLPTPSSGL